MRELAKGVWQLSGFPQNNINVYVLGDVLIDSGSLIGMLTGKGPEKRLAGTLAAVDFGVSAGAHIVRMHDVAEVSDFLALRAALRNDGMPELRGDRDDDSLKWIAPKS